jgi:hypothetical protein
MHASFRRQQHRQSRSNEEGPPRRKILDLGRQNARKRMQITGAQTTGASKLM